MFSVYVAGYLLHHSVFVTTFLLVVVLFDEKVESTHRGTWHPIDIVVCSTMYLYIYAEDYYSYLFGTLNLVISDD